MGKSYKKSSGKSDRKARIKENSFISTVLSVFTANPYKGFTFRQVSKQLGISDLASRELVKKILTELELGGTITEENRGKYFLKKENIPHTVTSTIVTGVVDMKRTGKAYVTPEDNSNDIFIGANNTYHALDGDKVKVFLFPIRRGRKLEGQITEIIERGRKEIVGIIERSKNYAFLVPDSPSIPIEIYIPNDKLNGAANGVKAIVRITEWPEHSRTPFGEVTQVLGKPGDHDVEMDSILVEFGFPVRFPDKVEKEADNIPTKISATEIARRKDIRNVFTITIDPEDAKDFDDAISLKKLPNGNYQLGVHIADVSHYVKPDSLIDREAYNRATSVYLVDRVIPMLPEKLSNEVCSLRPNEDKLCFSAIFEMDANAKVMGEWFGKTIIHSDRRFNYDEVQQMIEGRDGDYKEEVLIFNSLATKLREERYNKGAISFRSQEVKFRLDDEGKITDAYVREQKESNMLIEDFMLLANRRVAEKIGKRKGKQIPKTFVYRIHDQPNPEKLKTFVEFVGKLGYKINTGTRKGLATSFNNLFDKITGKGEQNLIETIAIRTMAKAVYSTENIGHYGLGFPYYTHFTSPIRRYPDLLVHRLLQGYLQGYLQGKASANADLYEEKCEHSSDMEKRAAQAERDSVKLKQAEYLADKIGQEFEGLISGVSKYGIFVEMLGSKAEGMVPLRSLKDDFYFLDEDNYRVMGQRYKQEYRLGDPVKVRVMKIDLSSKQIDLDLV